MFVFLEIFLDISTRILCEKWVRNPRNKSSPVVPSLMMFYNFSRIGYNSPVLCKYRDTFFSVIFTSPTGILIPRSVYNIKGLVCKNGSHKKKKIRKVKKPSSLAWNINFDICMLVTRWAEYSKFSSPFWKKKRGRNTKQCSSFKKK